MDVDEEFKMLSNTTQTIANNLMRQGADGPSAVFRAIAQSGDDIDLEKIIDIAGAKLHHPTRVARTVKSTTTTTRDERARF